jgi:hypothetical protein
MTGELLNAWGGVAGNIVAAIIVAASVGLFWMIVNRVRTWRKSARIADMISGAGISGFYQDRTQYVLAQDHGDVSKYIKTAHSTLTYVGMWLSHSTEQANVMSAIESLLDRGCTVEIVLLDHELEERLLEWLAHYLATDPGAMRTRLRESWDYFNRKSGTLSQSAKRRLAIKRHSALTTASAFLFDVGRPEAKTLVDMKFFHAPREKSLGMELRGQPESELYIRLTQSFQAIVHSAKT